MRELLIVVPDFYLPPDADTSAGKHFATAGSTLLGLSNIARYGTSLPINEGWRSRLAQWVGREDLTQISPAAVAAAVLNGGPGLEPGSQWIAEPVHLLTGLRSVHLDHAGLLRVDASTQVQLVRSFEDAFADAPYRLAALPSGRFLLTGPQTPKLRTEDPARYLGLAIDGAAPGGEGSTGLKRLAAEIEMWLHEHPMNMARARNRQRVISTLWLWGGGAPLTSPQIQASNAVLFGDDPYVDGLARLIGVEATRDGALDAVLASGADRAAVLVEVFRLPANSPVSTPMQALEVLDRQWIAPAFEATVRGDVQRLFVLANDRCLTISSRDRLKFWRRPRDAFLALQ